MCSVLFGGNLETMVEGKYQHALLFYHWWTSDMKHALFKLEEAWEKGNVENTSKHGTWNASELPRREVHILLQGDMP